MTAISEAPDLSRLDIPVDRWTEPFWAAAAAGELRLPRCGACGTFRWPPGPFCPVCRSQAVDWAPAGPGRLYSFTIVRQPVPGSEAARTIVPGLVEFPEAGGIRIMAAIVDTPVDRVRIGAPLALGWAAKDERRVPVFRIGPAPDRADDPAPITRPRPAARSRR